jgi:hypothetical protein
MLRGIGVALIVVMCGGCAYNLAPEAQASLASMSRDDAVKIVREALTTDEDTGRGICLTPLYAPGTKNPRFKSADTHGFSYLDNKGDSACTNDCKDPDHEFVIAYENIPRIFVTQTKAVAECSQEPGQRVVQIVSKHEGRVFVMASVPEANVDRVLAAFKVLNPAIALKNSY